MRQADDLQILLSTLQATTDELVKVQLHLENEVSTRRGLQQSNKELASKLTAKPYVVVVIDADANDYQFPRVAEGVKGGEQAADMLVARVKERVAMLGKEFEQCDIVVESYANNEGLGQALTKSGQRPSLERLRLFWTGFVCRQRMFSHVYVGRGKENADQRIRERTEFHSGVWQCKRVFLACCHNGGYATFLGQFVSSGKITLLKNEVCHPKLEALGCPTVELPGLFAQPLVSEIGAIPTGPAGRKNLQNPYALQGRLAPVLVDKNSGLRYDRSLSVKTDAVKSLEKMKLCNWFYLTGGCKGCERVQGIGLRLSVDEYDALWLLSRRGECWKSQKRRLCNEVVCIYGHKP